MPGVGRHGSGPAPLHATIKARLTTVDQLHYLGPDVRDVLKVELQRLVDKMNADPALDAEWTDPQLRVFTNADELAGVVVDLVKAVAPRSLAGEWLWDWRGLLEDLHDVGAGLVETQEKTAQERACEWVEDRRQVFLSPQLPLGGRHDRSSDRTHMAVKTVQPSAVCGSRTGCGTTSARSASATRTARPRPTTSCASGSGAATVSGAGVSRAGRCGRSRPRSIGARRWP